MESQRTHTSNSVFERALRLWQRIGDTEVMIEASSVIERCANYGEQPVDLLPLFIHRDVAHMQEKPQVRLWSTQHRHGLDRLMGMMVAGSMSRLDIMHDVETAAQSIVHDSSATKQYPGFAVSTIAQHLSKLSTSCFLAALSSRGISGSGRARDLAAAYMAHPDADWPSPQIHVKGVVTAWSAACAAVAKRAPHLRAGLLERMKQPDAVAGNNWREVLASARLLGDTFEPLTNYSESALKHIAERCVSDRDFAASVANAAHDVQTDNGHRLLESALPGFLTHRNHVCSSITSSLHAVDKACSANRTVLPVEAKTAWSWAMSIADGLGDVDAHNLGISIARRHFGLNEFARGNMPSLTDIGHSPVTLTQIWWSADMLSSHCQSVESADMTSVVETLAGRPCIPPGRVSSMIAKAALNGSLPSGGHRGSTSLLASMADPQDRAIVLVGLSLHRNTEHFTGAKSWCTDQSVWESAVKTALSSEHKDDIIALAMRIAIDGKGREWIERRAQRMLALVRE